MHNKHREKKDGLKQHVENGHGRLIVPPIITHPCCRQRPETKKPTNADTGNAKFISNIVKKHKQQMGLFAIRAFRHSAFGEITIELQIHQQTR